MYMGAGLDWSAIISNYTYIEVHLPGFGETDDENSGYLQGKSMCMYLPCQLMSQTARWPMAVYLS